MLRPTGSSTYQVVGETGDVALAGDGAVETFSPASPIDVETGDILGAFYVDTVEGCDYGGSGTFVYNLSTSDPSPGDTVTLPGSNSDAMDESAQFTPEGPVETDLDSASRVR